MAQIKLQNIKCLIFDLDGVIVDTDIGRYEVLNEILVQYGIDLKSNYTPEYLTGISTEKFLKDWFAYLPIHDIIAKRRYFFFRNLDKYCIEYPGAVETIKDLHKAGYELSLATSNDAQMTKKMLKHIGITEFFHNVLSREQTENQLTGKKDYGQVLKILDKKPGECIVIEDSPIGVVAAKNAHIFCIAFERYKSTVIHENADIIITDYEDLRRLFAVK